MQSVNPSVNSDEITELHFLIHYSYYLEIMRERLFSRLDKLVLYVQFMLASWVIASMPYSVLVGLLLILLAAIQFSYQYGTAASQSKNQAAKYKALRYELPRLTAQAIRQQLHVIEETDPPEVGALCLPAYWRTCIRLDHADLNNRMETLSRWQKIIAWLAGDLPTKPPHFLTQ